MDTEKNIALRKQAVAASRQIIVKAGTRLLIDRASIAKLVDGIAMLRKRGHRVLLVTSGAVGMGMELAGLEKRPKELAQKQALAAMGQTRLMNIYAEEAARHGFQVAQLLLTASDLRNRSRYLNVMNCINALWERDVLPIVNENDSVSVAELKFGDNDTLAGMLTSLTGAQMTVLLTTVDGLLGRNSDGTLGERIPVVEKITEKIRSLAGETDDSDLSTGGMASKLRAAGLSTASGAWLWIADGRMPDIISRILDGEDTGTLFLPEEHKVPGRKRWFGFFSRISGEITVDAGAQKAVLGKGGSLLPSGVTGVDGEFKRGDTVDICGADGRPFARGLVNFDSSDCRKIMGKHTAELPEILGTSAEAELIHRDHLILLER
ncbi:MAG: glutamate 5-kinase [Lentisphaerae bacterium]|nr:glutamate 5-kinase [Lentisphaerota bacterium]